MSFFLNTDLYIGLNPNCPKTKYKKTAAIHQVGKGGSRLACQTHKPSSSRCLLSTLYSLGAPPLRIIHQVLLPFPLIHYFVFYFLFLFALICISCDFSPLNLSGSTVWFMLNFPDSCKYYWKFPLKLCNRYTFLSNQTEDYSRLNYHKNLKKGKKIIE